MRHTRRLHGPAALPFRVAWSTLAVVLALLAGCGPGRQTPVYQDEEGFHLTPPPGWSERARPAAAPGPTAGQRRGLAARVGGGKPGGERPPGRPGRLPGPVGQPGLSQRNGRGAQRGARLLHHGEFSRRGRRGAGAGAAGGGGGGLAVAREVVVHGDD